jgi:integrase
MTDNVCLSVIVFEPRMNELISLQPTIAQAQVFVEASQAPDTRRAYAADWVDFSAWCAKRQLTTLPASSATVALYLADLAAPADPQQRPRKVSTIQRRLAAIVARHRMHNYDSPAEGREVRAVMAGIRRTLKVAPAEKQPISLPMLQAMLLALPETIKGWRDRAVLLVGFAGAFRRSELVDLDLEDVQFTPEGMVITLRSSKTDQEGRGAYKAIPYGLHQLTCPVRTLQRWIEAAQVHQGRLFRSMRSGRVQTRGLLGRDVARIVKAAAAAAGFDPTELSGHSLRAGFATSAALAGVEEYAIMEQTGHRSVMTLRRYVRKGSLFRNNAAARIGL